MRTLLIDPHDLATLARPVSLHLDEKQMAAYIREAQDLYIVPAIGYDTVKRLLTAKEYTDEDDILLNGGEYTKHGCGCTDEVAAYCYGLKKTLAYYAWARLARTDGSIVSRAGVMRHNEQYSQHADDKDTLHNDAMDIAGKYLNSCLDYLKQKRPQRLGRGLHFSLIGD